MGSKELLLGHEILYCSQCQVQLRGREFDQGEAFRIDVKAVCRKCAPEVIKSLPPDKVQILLKQMVVAQGRSAPKEALRPSTRDSAGERNPAPQGRGPRVPSLTPLWVGLSLVFALVLGLAGWMLTSSARPTAGGPGSTPPAPVFPKTSSPAKEPAGSGQVRVPDPPPLPAAKDPGIRKTPEPTRDPTIPGLVGHWKLDEGAGAVAADSSGNGNRATLVNGPTWVPGKQGTALSFDGGKAVLNVDSGTSLTNLHRSGLTVCAWISPRGHKRGQIVDKSNGNVGWILAWKEDSQLEFSGDQFRSSELRRFSFGAISPNAWHHVAATWDGNPAASHVHLYVDGLPADGKGEDGGGAVREDPSTPLSIGNRHRQDRGFDGLIDDVRIYNRVLSASEILGLVKEGSK